MKRHILLTCLLGIPVCVSAHSMVFTSLHETPQVLTRAATLKRSVLVIIYMAARNDLSMYLETHIKQLLTIGSTERVKIFVHLDLQKTDSPLLTRNFFVEKNKLTQVGDNNPCDSGKKETLINAAAMAYEEFPADDVVLILWNHGTGPIEPKIAPAINQWELWHVDEATGKIDLDQSVGYLDRFAPGEGSFGRTKGICFDDSTGSYLTTKELTSALRSISQDIIKKKLSIVACDACLMAGIDVFTGLHEYADYFVASQEVELGLGYKYDRLIEPLLLNKVCCGEELACHFVQSFKEYYSPKIDFYTHVAIDLSYSTALEKNIEKLARCLSYGLEHQKDGTVKEAIRLSRHKKNCVRFNEPTYLDLKNLYINLLKNRTKCTLKSGSTQEFQKFLYEILQEGLSLIQKAVRANAVGSKHEQASGISIYFPEFIIHGSYQSNDFAQRTYWLPFLQNYIATR
jgi:hypothetical protein